MSELTIHKQQRVLNLARKIVSEPKGISAYENSLSLKIALSTPSMRSVFKGENTQIAFSVVKVIVSRFLQSFGFSTKPSEMQIEMISSDALDNFSYESLVDLVVFFKMARQGKFGETQRGVDSNLIFGKWFPMYLELKSEMREGMIETKKGERKKDVYAVEKVKKTYAKIVEKQNKAKAIKFTEKVKNYIEQETKLMDRQMLEDWILEWEKDPQRKPYVGLLKQKRKVIK